MGFHVMILSKSKPKGAPTMEATEKTQLQIVRELVTELVADCPDADLLDLIAKLLLQSASG